jgi:hypothetical protein
MQQHGRFQRSRQRLGGSCQPRHARRAALSWPSALKASEARPRVEPNQRLEARRRHPMSDLSGLDPPREGGADLGDCGYGRGGVRRPRRVRARRPAWVFGLREDGGDGVGHRARIRRRAARTPPCFTCNGGGPVIAAGLRPWAARISDLDPPREDGGDAPFDRARDQKGRRREGGRHLQRHREG